MTYKNFPVYIGQGNKIFAESAGYHKRNMIYAESVNINYSTSSKPYRKLGRGVDPDRQYTYDTDLTCAINLSFYFYSEPRRDGGDQVYAFLSDSNQYKSYILGNGTGQNFFPLKIGGNVYNKCFIDSYSIDVSAFQPIKCNVNFRSFSPPKDGATASDGLVPFSSYDDSISGQAVINSNMCELSGLYDDIVFADVIPKITYERRYSRTPVYGIGSVEPINYLMDAAESQLVVESTGLNKFTNYDGVQITGDIGLKIQDSDGNRILPEYDGGFDFIVASGAKLNSYSYSVPGGDVIKTSSTINEVVL